MAVPAAPTNGEPIAEAWGDVVHDAMVQRHYEFGVLTVNLVNALDIGVPVVFARPFKTAPIMSVATPEIGGGSNRQFTAKFNGLTPTGVNIVIQSQVGGTGVTLTFPVPWMAYGETA